MSIFQRILSNRVASRLAPSLAVSQLQLIRRKLKSLEKLSDQEITRASLTLQYASRSGKPLKSLLPDAFALTSEVTRRVYSMVPYDVQLLGGIHLCDRTIVEMATGELSLIHI